MTCLSLCVKGEHKWANIHVTRMPSHSWFLAGVSTAAQPSMGVGENREAADACTETVKT